jgi:Fe-S cluster assembly protein SufD
MINIKNNNIMQELSWLDAEREKSKKSFNSQGLPNRGTEDWRYSFKSVNANNPTKGNADTDLLLSSIRETSLYKNSHVMVVVDGKIDFSLSKNIPNGVIDLSSNFSAASSSLTADDEFSNQAMVRLNTANVADGYVININHDLEKTIYILNISGENSVTYSHNVINCVAGSNTTIIEHSIGNNEYYINNVTKVNLARDAVLNHYKLQNDSLQAQHLAENKYTLSDNSELNHFIFSLGGKLARNAIHAEFIGENATANSHGVYLGKEKQVLDHYLPFIHAKPNNKSSQIYRGVLDDQAIGVFYGKIIVLEHAQKTDSYQMNKNILLSDKAVANSRPELEVLADDVQCAHGTAIGELDKNALFYLKARGLDDVTAKGMMINGFVSEVVEMISKDDIHELIESHVNEWLAVSNN